MNAKEIKIQNIKNLGYKVGTVIKDNKAEISLKSRHFRSCWSVDENCALALVEQIKEEIVEIEDLYIQSGSYLSDGDIIQFSFEEDYLKAEAEFNLEELIKTNFEGLKSCYIYLKPKIVGYFSLSNYDVDKKSQMKMVKEFIKQFDGVELYGNFEDTDWNYSCMEFPHIGSDGYRYVDDYDQYHGNSRYAENKGDCEYVYGRLCNWNETVLNNFWSFGPDEEGWLNEIDPCGTIAVYTRKGKDWFIGYSLEEREFYISYEDRHGKLVEEEKFYALVYQQNQELRQNVVNIVKSWKNDVEAEGYIYNQFDFNVDNDDRTVDKDVAQLLYEESDDFRNEVIDNIQKWGVSTIDEEFFKAYNKVVDKKVNILDDKTVELTYTPFELGSEEPYIKKFNHLKKMERFGRVLGFEVVHSSVGTSEIKSYAIRKDNEEYHFDIVYLVAQDVFGEQTLKEAIKEMLESIERRKLEMIEEEELLKKASHVFVSVDDSLDAGNCKVGTSRFLRDHNIDTSKIGGIRGDELLNLEMSDFVKRAVVHALSSHCRTI